MYDRQRARGRNCSTQMRFRGFWQSRTRGRRCCAIQGLCGSRPPSPGFSWRAGECVSITCDRNASRAIRATARPSRGSASEYRSNAVHTFSNTSFTPSAVFALASTYRLSICLAYAAPSSLETYVKKRLAPVLRASSRISYAPASLRSCRLC